MRSRRSTRFGRSVSASCVAWYASSASARRRLLHAQFARVEEHGETSDDDHGHDRGDEDDDDLVHVVASEGPVAASTGGKSNAAASNGRDASGGCRALRDAGRVLRSDSAEGCAAASAEHPEAHDVPGVDPLRRRVAVQQADRVLCEIAASIRRETGAEEPHRSTSSPGHQQQPERHRGDEHDIEKRIRRRAPSVGRCRRRP